MKRILHCDLMRILNIIRTETVPGRHLGPVSAAKQRILFTHAYDRDRLLEMICDLSYDDGTEEE